MHKLANHTDENYFFLKRSVSILKYEPVSRFLPAILKCTYPQQFLGKTNLIPYAPFCIGALNAHKVTNEVGENIYSQLKLSQL